MRVFMVAVSFGSSPLTVRSSKCSHLDKDFAKVSPEFIGHLEPQPIKGVVVRNPHTHAIQSLLHVLLSPASPQVPASRL